MLLNFILSPTDLTCRAAAGADCIRDDASVDQLLITARNEVQIEQKTCHKYAIMYIYVCVCVGHWCSQTLHKW